MSAARRLAERLIGVALAASAASGCLDDQKQEVSCYTATLGDVCVAPKDAKPRLSVSHGSCSDRGKLASVDDGPVIYPPTRATDGPGCCYLVTKETVTTPGDFSLGCGRPLITRGVARRALLVRAAWT